MSSFNRQLLTEIHLVFALALAPFTALTLLIFLGNQAVMARLGIWPLVCLIPYLLPDVLRYTVPTALLFAVSSVYGRMSSSNELLALKSLGISPLAAVWPVLVLAFFMSLATVCLTSVADSWGHNGVMRVVVRSAEEIAYAVLRTDRCYSTPHLAITVKRVEGRRLISPTLTLLASDAGGIVTMTAREAEIRSDPSSLRLVFRHGRIDFGRDTSLQFPDTVEQAVPLDDASRKEVRQHMTLGEIPGAILRQEARVKQLEQELAVGAVGALDPEARQVVADQFARERWRLGYLRAVPHRCWAHGFSCLSFVMLGVPLAILLRNGDHVTTFFAAFLPIALLAYPLDAFMAMRTDWPHYSVWLSDIMLCVTGAWLLRKVVLH